MKREGLIVNPFNFDPESSDFFGPPNSFPGRQGPPSNFPPMQGPPTPPPSFVPQPPTEQFATQRGGRWSINSCLFRHTYIWLGNGRSFWFFPIAVTRNQVIGFRWRNRGGWQYSVINRGEIFTFSCFF
ncbi:MAG: hypothetical protein ABS949_09645 [Solibacillus sp.]